jgi:DNA-binding XRE family transcriptional regulator
LPDCLAREANEVGPSRFFDAMRQNDVNEPLLTRVWARFHRVCSDEGRYFPVATVSTNANYDWQTAGRLAGSLAPVPDRAAKLQRQLGVIVRAERKTRKLTQQELAFEAELSLTYVGEIERGQRMVSLDTLQRIAAALDLTGAELLAKAGI